MTDSELARQIISLGQYPEWPALVEWLKKEQETLKQSTMSAKTGDEVAKNQIMYHCLELLIGLPTTCQSALQAGSSTEPEKETGY